MRRTVLLLALMVAAMLGSAGAASAVEMLDQQNTGPLESPGNFERFNSYEYVAQAFTPEKTGELSKVSLLIAKETCGAGSLDSQYEDISVRIYRVGLYSTNSFDLRASTTLPASQVPYRQCDAWPTQWTDVTFDPGNRARLTRGLKYAIALEPMPSDLGGSQPDYLWYYTTGGGYYYTGGGSYYRRSDIPNFGWQQPWALDFLFKEYVDIPDTDGDGLTDDVDECDNDPGSASMNGCPISMDTVSPKGSVKINRGAKITRSRTVTLSLTATDPTPSSGVDSMRIKNAGGDWASWQPHVSRKDWKLTRGEGKKTVYVQYKDLAGNLSATASDSITYRP